VPDANVPSGHVAQVVQAGYMIGERVLRPALVGISKAAPKPQPTGDNPPN
jgi:molecular chaperone GrpE